MFLTKKAIYYIENNNIVSINLDENVSNHMISSIKNDICKYKNVLYVSSLNTANLLKIWKYENSKFTEYFSNTHILHYTGFDPKRNILFYVNTFSNDVNIININTKKAFTIHDYKEKILKLDSNESEIIVVKTENKFSSLIYDEGIFRLCIDYDITDIFNKINYESMDLDDTFTCKVNNKLEIIKDINDIILKYDNNILRFKNKQYNNIYQFGNVAIILSNYELNYIIKLINGEIVLNNIDLTYNIKKCRKFGNKIFVLDEKFSVCYINIENDDIVYTNADNFKIKNGYIWLLKNDKVISCLDENKEYTLCTRS